MTEISCDGSCLGNPGPGGWAAVISPPGQPVRVRSGGEANTTNNRMELTAVIRALEAVPAETRGVVFCDSQYVVRGITRWIGGWKRRGWKTAGKQPVKNRDLWKRLDAARLARPGIGFRWVRGHAGHPGNERAHEAALAEAERQQHRSAAFAAPSVRRSGPARRTPAGADLFAFRPPRRG